MKKGGKNRFLLLLPLLACLLLSSCAFIGREEKTTAQGQAEEDSQLLSENVDGAASVSAPSFQAGSGEKTASPEERASAVSKAATLTGDAEKILKNATASFLCHYPVDENFIFFVADTCGKAAVHALAQGNDYSDPEQWYRCCGKSIHVLWDSYCRTTGISYAGTKRTKVLNLSGDRPAVFAFTGDIGLAESLATTSYMDLCENGLSDCFSADLLDNMRSADVLLINNEFAYTDRGSPIPGKSFTFRADPRRVAELAKIGTDIVNLANNHVFDYGEEGLLDTLDTLKNAGYPVIGAGRNLSEAMQPYYFIAGSRKVAIVSATQIERTMAFTQEATETGPGVLKTLHPDKFVREIQEAKKNADIVLCYVHWGSEGVSGYGSDQEKLAHAFAAAGADAIIGGHTHCLQGIEYVDGVPCYYSLGNFWFSATGDMPERYDTGLAEIAISSDGRIQAAFVPCYFENGVTSEIVDKKERRALFDRITALSQTTAIADDGTIMRR